jgi:AcrR family transcriptional regulator
VQVGPVRVHPKDICEELGVSKALVNYHFGGRDGLLAEAIVLGYQRYVDTLWDAAERAGSDPVERLLAWVDRQIVWTCENAGLAVALNFPRFSFELPADIAEVATKELTVAGGRNFANLQRLVADARRSLATDSPASAAEGATGHDADQQVTVALDAALIGWLTLGLAVWQAGEHLPTKELGESPLVDSARRHAREQILEMLRR